MSTLFAYLPMVRSGKKGLFLGILDSHLLGTILFPLNTCCSWVKVNNLNPAYTNDTSVPPSHFGIHLNKFGQPDDGASMFYWNFGIFNHNHNVMQTPNRSLSLAKCTKVLQCSDVLLALFIVSYMVVRFVHFFFFIL